MFYNLDHFTSNLTKSLCQGQVDLRFTNGHEICPVEVWEAEEEWKLPGERV
jgi:hypothetical protein